MVALVDRVFSMHERDEDPALGLVGLAADTLVCVRSSCTGWAMLLAGVCGSSIGPARRYSPGNFRPSFSLGPAEFRRCFEAVG